MPAQSPLPRRRMLFASAAALGGTVLPAAGAAAADLAPKLLRIGVISATNRGKVQRRNGHTWHFAQYFHPTINLDAFCAMVDPGSATFFRKYVRDPRNNFDQLPFPDTRITHYFDADP